MRSRAGRFGDTSTRAYGIAGRVKDLGGSLVLVASNTTEAMTIADNDLDWLHHPTSWG